MMLKRSVKLPPGSGSRTISAIIMWMTMPEVIRIGAGWKLCLWGRVISTLTPFSNIFIESDTKAASLWRLRLLERTARWTWRCWTVVLNGFGGNSLGVPAAWHRREAVLFNAAIHSGSGNPIDTGQKLSVENGTFSNYLTEWVYTCMMYNPEFDTCESKKWLQTQ